MAKLKFTRRHAGLFILLTMLGVLVGWNAMLVGLEESLKQLLVAFAFGSLVIVFITAVVWVTSPDKESSQ